MAMLSFNFSSTKIAYKRLAQALSSSVSASSSFMREKFDPFVKADKRAQYVDDIGLAANKATELIWHYWAVFKCIRQAVSKMKIKKCHFPIRHVDFLGRLTSPEGISPQARNIRNFFNNLRFHKSKNVLQRNLAFWNYYRNYIPRIIEKLNPFYKSLKA